MDESPEDLEKLDKLAKMAVDYVEEQTHQLIRRMADDPTVSPPTGEEKKQAALQAMRSMAPKARFTDAQADIAIDGAVQVRRASLRPPPGAL